ncbi:MAG: flagellar FlbD family protein [bacterium]
MIKLHRLNGQEVVINAELIEAVESTPDTLLSLTTGNKYLVKENAEYVIEEIKKYRHRVINGEDEKQS